MTNILFTDLAYSCVSWGDRPVGRWEGKHQRCYLAYTSHHHRGWIYLCHHSCWNRVLNCSTTMEHQHFNTGTANPAARISCPGNTDNWSIQHHLNFHLHPRERFFSREVQQSLPNEYKKPYIPLKENQVFRLVGSPKAFIEDENFQWPATMKLKLWNSMWPKLWTFFFVFSSILLDTNYCGLCLCYPLIYTWRHCRFLY